MGNRFYTSICFPCLETSVQSGTYKPCLLYNIIFYGMNSSHHISGQHLVESILLHLFAIPVILKPNIGHMYMYCYA